MLGDSGIHVEQKSISSGTHGTRSLHPSTPTPWINEKNPLIKNSVGQQSKCRRSHIYNTFSLHRGALAILKSVHQERETHILNVGWVIKSIIQDFLLYLTAGQLIPTLQMI